MDFLNISDGPSAIGEVRTPILIGLVIVWLINWAVVYRGVQRGIELANKVLMPGGNIFGALFFLSLTVAGISSAVSIIEAFISAVVDKFGVSPQKLVTLVSVMGFLGAVVFTTQAGLFWLDSVDHFLTHYGLVIVGILECIVVGWLFKLPPVT